MSKKTIEKKIREEQEATAHAFQEFIKTFQDYSGPPNKTFVKSGILNAKTGVEIESEKGKIYSPQPLFKQHINNSVKKAIECARLIKENQLERVKGQEKPKTNLQLLKEELKLKHMERDIKNKMKDHRNLYSSFDSKDPTSTNLFIANINPKITEQNLMTLFGSYGPLASIKIMWPRGEEKNRNSNCGFVAFMSRKDGERALNALKDRDDMRVGWGKPVELPDNPVYLPPELLKLSSPPPFSGLPFNAQPIQKLQEYPDTEEEMNKILYHSYVKVTIPLDKTILMIIHRTIEFVIREGPLFEAMLMNREINNPLYQFLFDNKSPVHIYYRWKLYTVLHGETRKNWSTEPFRMFKNGSVWIPPIIPNYSDGMPEHLYNISNRNVKNILSGAQTTRFLRLIQNLTLDRHNVGEVMVFCLNHSDTVADIIEIIVDSFASDSTKPQKKLARLYLISDLLYNSTMKKWNSGAYLKEIQKYLLDIFQNLHKTLKNINSSVDKDVFKIKVIKVIKAWNLFKSYDNEFLDKLELTFLGIAAENDDTDDDYATDDPLDGTILIKTSLSTATEYIVNPNIKKEKENVKPTPILKNHVLPGFVPSRWEIVDPDEVEAQAMSTKKIYDLQLEHKFQAAKGMEECETKKLTEYDREVLRKVELMVMQFQDDLESGECKTKKGITIEKEVNCYRNHLIEKLKAESKHKSQKIKCSLLEISSRNNEAKKDGVKNKKHKKRDSKTRK